MVVGGCAASMDKTFTTVLKVERKTSQPPYGRRKCTPSAACGGVSPRESVSHDSQSPAAPYESCSLATPEGEILAALCFEMFMRTNAERREDFHLKVKRLTMICASLALLQIMFTVHPAGWKYRRRRG